MQKHLRITLAQINPTVGDLEGNSKRMLEIIKSHAHDLDILVFPELCVTGYPPEDLVLSSCFIDDVEKKVKDIVAATEDGHAAVLIPAPVRENGLLYNGVIVADQGHVIGTIKKHHLPNYGVFDEERTFARGPFQDPVTIKGHKIGIMICEDMWFPDVAQNLKQKGAEILLIPNGSPFEGHKDDIRLTHANRRVAETKIPLIYLNQVGGQDDLVFDGASFILNADGSAPVQLPAFMDVIYTSDWDISTKPWMCKSTHQEPALDEIASIYQALTLGTRDYILKNGFSNILLGLSGGIDSALVAAIAVDALGANHVHTYMLPSPFTSKESKEDAAFIAQTLNCSFDSINITGMMDSTSMAVQNLSGLAHENMQSRIRGLILMALSNQKGALVLTTGNKSEIATGYCTLYGDMCGGFNPIKDVYKTQIYALAKWRNKNRPFGSSGPDGNVFSDRILIKAPSAELKDNQTDQDTLPPYDTLDDILQCLIERRMSTTSIVARGHETQTVIHVRKLLKTSEYKRRQAAPGPKITPLAFGRDRRMPMTTKFL